MSTPPKNLPARAAHRLQRIVRQAISNWRLFLNTRQVTAHARYQPDQRPVVFFNASTRLTNVSLNAAFSYLAACGVQLAGTPVVHFACRAGMSRCVLGTQRDNPQAAPPCRDCLRQSRWLYANAPVQWFDYRSNKDLDEQLEGKSVPELSELEFASRPLGELVLPGLRWALRRHHLVDDEPTRFLLREYILSAHTIAEEFQAFLDQVDPRALVVFNGMMYPEATARWVARQRGLRVITHEVGLQPFSAYFTAGEATAYPIDIPDDFELSEEQNARLDAYLEQRFKGKFSMAGIQFWPEMSSLSPGFLEYARRFKQIVPVFTNVIFDTSQIHANTVFPHMFAWLEEVLEIIRAHPETLFVLRAHPDETRPGKESRESVQEWVERCGIKREPNVVFISSHEYVSSYELIQRSKFVMVYNSSIGLEASLMGAPVLCGGKARFTQLSTVFFPQSPAAFRQRAEAFLNAERVESPPEHRRNARRFLYYQLFRTSLPFGEFIEEAGIWPGFVRLKPFHWQRLAPRGSPSIRAVVNGILQGGDFLLEEPERTK